MSLLGRVALKGLRRGVFEGSRGWLVVGVSATAIAALRKVMHEDETVYTTPLRADEGLEIRVVKPGR